MDLSEVWLIMGNAQQKLPIAFYAYFFGWFVITCILVYFLGYKIFVLSFLKQKLKGAKFDFEKADISKAKMLLFSLIILVCVICCSLAYHAEKNILHKVELTKAEYLMHKEPYRYKVTKHNLLSEGKVDKKGLSEVEITVLKNGKPFTFKTKAVVVNNSPSNYFEFKEISKQDVENLSLILTPTNKFIIQDIFKKDYNNSEYEIKQGVYDRYIYVTY